MRHCTAVISLQLQKLDLIFFYILILRTHTKFVTKNPMLALGGCFPQTCSSAGRRLKITCGLLLTNLFVFIKTNSKKCFVNWIPANSHDQLNKIWPWLVAGYTCLLLLLFKKIHNYPVHNQGLLLLRLICLGESKVLCEVWPGIDLTGKGLTVHTFIQVNHKSRVTCDGR